MYELREQEYDYFDTIMNKSLMGMAKIHNSLIALEECNAILRKDYANMIGKVKLISGSRAENELIYPGVVGPGMLTAAVLGNTFSAPSVDNILRVIEEVGFDYTEGCGQIQGNIFILELLQQIEINGLKLKRIYMKEFMKYSNSNGFHICLLNLSFNTILIKYLDFPTFVSTWPVALGLEAIETKKHDKTKLITLKKDHKNMDWNILNLQGPTMNHKTSQTFLLIISMACEAIIACERQLNIMDQKYGNGNYGTSLACGAKAIQNAIQKNELLGTNLYITFLQISHIIQKTVSDIRGRLYFLFFFYIAEAFSKYENDKEITVDVWLHVLITANKAIEQFKASSVGDQILLTTLTAVQIDLQNALSRNVDPIDAFGIAVKAAENFTTNVLYTQSSHELKYPDPQAHSVGIWMRAAYEGTKLKLIYRNTK